MGSVTRPVKELKGFTRVRLDPGASTQLTFSLSPEDLAFYDQHMNLVAEPGRFCVWVGGSSAADLMAEFSVLPA